MLYRTVTQDRADAVECLSGGSEGLDEVLSVDLVLSLKT